MVRVIIRPDQIPQDIDVYLSVISCKIFPHFGFQGLIESFHHTGFNFFIVGSKEVNSFPFQVLLKMSIGKLLSLICLLVS